MTARMGLAVRGQDTGWWEDDDPSALRREENREEGVKKTVNNESSIGEQNGNTEVSVKCGPIQSLQTFEEIIDELNRREKNNTLKYSDDNVDLIVESLPTPVDK